MFKKICAVLLMLLVRVYDAWAIYSMPKLVCQMGSTCGAQYLTANTDTACSQYCNAMGYPKYYRGIISQVSTTSIFCACYSQNSVLNADMCSCYANQCQSGFGRVAGTYNSRSGEVTSLYCSLCASKSCNSVSGYETYLTKYARKKHQYCSVGAGGVCVDHDTLYDYACASGYYGSPLWGVAASSYPTCTRCLALDGVYPTTTPGYNSYASNCVLYSGNYSGTSGNFSLTSACYPQKS